MRKLKFLRVVTFVSLMVAIGLVSVRVGAQQQAAAGSSASKSSAAADANDSGEEAVTPGQREFAEAYVQIVEAQDVAKMRTLIPPTTLKCFDGDKQKFLEAWIEKQLTYQIPKDYQISVSRIPPEMSKSTKAATFPVPRTHEMEFEYATETNTVTVSQEIGTETGRWYLIPPCPTAMRMAQFTKKEEKLAIARDRAAHAYAELKEPLKSQLLALIAKNDNRGAMKLCISSLHVDSATAHELIDKLASEKRG
jgi:hypothetical protein